jgi:hypothetical protein
VPVLPDKRLLICQVHFPKWEQNGNRRGNVYVAAAFLALFVADSIDFLEFGAEGLRGTDERLAALNRMQAKIQQKWTKTRTDARQV